MSEDPAWTRLKEFIQQQIGIVTQRLDNMGGNSTVNNTTIYNNENIEREVEIHSGGKYVENWTQGFKKVLYHGKRGTAYYETEMLTDVEITGWTTPEILPNANTLKTDPNKQQAVRVRNTKNGSTPDPIYVATPKAHKDMAMVFEANLPSPTGKTNHYIGFEVNNLGKDAGMVALNLNGGAYRLTGTDYKRKWGGANQLTTPVTINNPDVFARYSLVWDKKYLRLYQPPVGSPNGELTNTHSLDLVDIRGTFIPFFANEDTGISEFQLGELWIYELEKNLLEAAKTPHIYNVTMTLADTQYSQALPAHFKKIQVSTRDRTAMRYAWTAGQVVAGPYFTIYDKEVYWDDDIDADNLTIYVASGNAGKTAEIHIWV